MAKTALVAPLECKRHDPGPGHPEQPARMDAVRNALRQEGLMEKLLPLPSRTASNDELRLVHTTAYIELARYEIFSGARDLSTGDTAVCRDSFDAALIAAGSVLRAVDAVFTDEAQNAFCCVRPPGHHATPDRGMGFCLFNNVAIGARYAQRKYGCERVAIVDWDVHHGNGTQETFWSDGTVLFFSTHQYPWYPGTGAAHEMGEGKGKGLILNCPFPAGAGFTEIGGAFRDRLLPALHKFRPELILISAGFDCRRGDPLGRFTLSDEDFAELTRLMTEAAHRHANGRLVSVLEGGYNLEGLGKAVAAHVRALTESD